MFLSIVKKLLESLKSSKSLVSKIIVGSVFRLAGIRAWLASIVVKKLVDVVVKVVKNEVQKAQDKETIKEGDRLQALPATPEVVKQREDNFKELLEGKK